MELVRWIACPRCGRRVRLTAPELEAKRGFCASCDARIELGEESRIGDGPGRELVHIPTSLMLAPPTNHLVVRNASPLEVEIRTRRSPVVLAVSGGAFALFAGLALWLASITVALGLGPLWLPMLTIAWIWRPQRDVVKVQAGSLEVRRGRRLRGKIAVDEHSDLAVSRHALVVTTDKATLEVGQGFQLQADELRWLREAIRSAVRHLPGTEPSET